MSSRDNRFRNRTGGVTSSATVKYAGGAALVRASFLRPADVTPYDVGDLVADKTVAGQVAPLAFVAAREFASSFFIMKARLSKTNVNVGNAVFVLHLYGEQPMPANGDNGAFQSNKAAAYLGAIGFPAMRAFNDGAWGAGLPVDGGPITVDLGLNGAINANSQADNNFRTIWGLLEVRGAYVPTNAEKFEVTLELQQD
jgi:hypothetical protein